MRADDVYKVIGGILVTVVAMYGCFALIQFVAQSPLWTAEGAAWVQAFGSIAAILTAFWIGHRDASARAQEAKVIAKIASIEMAHKIGAASLDLVYLGEFLDAAKIVGYPSPELNIALHDFQRIPTWTVAEVTQLAALSQAGSITLAKAKRVLDDCHYALEKTVSHAGFIVDDERRFSAAQRVHARLKMAAELLAQASAELDECDI
ncbi:hypothetical protein [Massilia sp. YMA4]|uniref:hypothetical protein n=1 Tax=Massilia sp. YMA4 TaxID=1593482 RepID=UPI001583FB69|nr:hypothetical protein [Massilia sp. YMA4]